MPKNFENGESSDSLFLLPAGVHPRKHSAAIDKQFGFRIKKIENKLSQKYQSYDQTIAPSVQKRHFPDTEAWIGLNPDALQTPYNEIYDALSFIKGIEDNANIDTIVDIGAAYGRVAFVKEELYPKTKFLGYEVVKKRQQEGQRVFEYHNLLKSKLVVQNVLEENFDLPEAQIYFIYDFSDSGDVSHILRKLTNNRRKDFFLIAHGERTLNLLSQQFRGFKRIFKVSGERSLSVFIFSGSEGNDE
jgi:ribosomal protein RSM22 (predicted rRNA methylase)